MIKIFADEKSIRLCCSSVDILPSKQGRQFVLKSGGDKDQMKKHYSRTGKILNNGASKMGIA